MVVIRESLGGWKEGKNGIDVGWWPCVSLLVSWEFILSFVKLERRGVESS